MLYTSDLSGVTARALSSLYESVGFGVAEDHLASPDFVARVYPPGVYGFFCFEPSEGALVGMARVFSDDVLCSWIAEICVHPRWQSRSIGKTLMANVVARFGHTALHADVLVEKVEFFKRFGVDARSKLVACSRAPGKTAAARTP